MKPAKNKAGLDGKIEWSEGGQGWQSVALEAPNVTTSASGIQVFNFAGIKI
ncbi:hypothetical protein [Aeromonas salmonicida]|uniref:hypothetical protein n=1 Tax=Aeromonas salmonicida TaxID=645 RepID=UPI00131582EC|nr:hypothetical protein [Aeromonas salmonicida]